MSQKTETPGSSYDSDSLNPAERLYQQEVNPTSQGADFNQWEKEMKGADDFSKWEKEMAKGGDDGKNPPGGVTGTPGATPEIPFSHVPKPQSRWQQIRTNKKALTGIGVGGSITTLVLAGFISFLPLKLEMLVQQAMSQAMQIPQDAVEKRLQYLVSYYLAMKALGIVNPADVVPGTPASSFLKTASAAKLEERLGVKIESTRDTSGQRATHWKITYMDGTQVEGRDGDLTDITREIHGSAAMRKFMKNEFKSDSHFDQAMLRLGGRKNAMRRVGVTRWAWPDTVNDKLDSFAERRAAMRKELRTRLYEVTIKRIIKRSGAHLSCLTDEKECPDLNKLRYGTRLDNPPVSDNADPANCPEGSAGDACRANAEANRARATEEINSSLAAVEAEVDKAIESGDSSKEISKIISKQMLSKVAGPVGIVDTIARIVGAVSAGALSQVVFDRNSIALAGYAAENMSFASQMREGKMTLEKFTVISDMLGDYGSSPAWQAFIGIISPAAKAYQRECGADKEPETLPPGQTVCPERMVISDRSTFTQAVWWQPLAAFADAYLGTVGKLFDLFNKVLEITGATAAIEKVVSALMQLVPDAVKSLMGKAVNNILTLVFGAPVNGDDTGKEAGDNVVGGIVSLAYLLGESSLDLDANNEPNGTGLGIGGTILAPAAVGAMQERIAREEEEVFAAKPLHARLFDTQNTRSLVSQLAIRTPTSTGELGSFASVLSNSFASLFMPKARAAASTNPFFAVNIMYGYADTDKLDQDPKQYTDEKCAQLEKEREESYISPRDSNHKYPIWVYTKPNHCALEKLAAAAGSAAYTSEYPKDFSLENDNSATPQQPDGPGGPGSSDPPSAQGFTWPIALAQYKPLSNCYRKPGHTGIDIPIGVGTPVHAAKAGTVVRIDTVGVEDSGKYVMIKHDDGKWTNYQHLSSVSVARGATVTTGQRIGLSGNTGFSTGPHLHFSVTTEEGLDSRSSVSYSINPLPFLPADRSLGKC